MRRAVCLNGEWEFMPLYEHESDLELPAELVYEQRKVQVPSSWRQAYESAPGRSFGEIPELDYSPYDLYGYPKEWDRAEAGVLHRTFRMPASMEGPETRIFLRFDGIMQKAAVYLDRRRIALWQDGYLPLLTDVTELVKAGSEHDLHVVCGSFDKVMLPSGQQKVTGLVGSWFGKLARGIWQDVYLESRPAVSLADISIRTSVRENRLEVEAAVSRAVSQPRPAESAAAPLKVVLTVRENSGDSDGREPSLPILRAEAFAEAWAEPEPRAESGEGNEYGIGGGMPHVQSSPVAFRLDWADAKLWNPDQPFLYKLELKLMDGDRVIDRVEERFGFREIWTAGSRFILNGTPVNLRGDSWHFQGGIQQTEAYVRNWYRMCKEAGVNCIRLHAEPHPAYYLDIADEEGMLIVDETAIYGSGKSMQADHPDFIAGCMAHVRRLVQRDKNHPSVVMWSVQNEMRWVDGRDGYKLHLPAMMHSMRALDPTRPIIAEGDNRLLPKELTEVESRHYNIDGTIAQWDRSTPLVFGEHGGWWYVCPQNSSMYAGLKAYRNTDECVKGLAEKERLFVEYARRHEVSGISTFNFAHYFMRAMPDRDIPLPAADLSTPGPKLRVIPRYSLSLNNGLLPAEYPAYRKNPSFDIMAASFKPATLIPAEYNRSFFDDEPIARSFDVYNDTLHTHRTRIECKVRQGDRIIHRESFEFVQEPAEKRTITLNWMPEPVAGAELSALRLHAVMLHENKPVHELELGCKLYPSRLKTAPVAVGRPVAYIGGDRDYRVVGSLAPGCGRLAPEQLGQLPADHLLVVGSKLEDADGRLENELKSFVGKGGRVLLLEQLHLSLGKLALSRQDFIRAHAGSYNHPILQGLSDDDLMFWHEEVREEGPLPIIRAAFEKPVKGDFTLILECSAGDFGDGGDLWSPLLEYRSGNGLFIANQLELIDNYHKMPQACLFLRNMLAYAGSADKTAASPSAPVSAGAFVEPGGAAEAFLRAIRLNYDALQEVKNRPLEAYGLIVAEPRLLADPEMTAALRNYALHGGKVIVLPAEPGQEAALAGLLKRSVRIGEHETYHLEADYARMAVRGISPVDLFGFDKVPLSPRDVVNRPLARNSLTADGIVALCTSVEGTAWKDYFVGQYADEYSRLAIVELNRDKARPSGYFVVQAETGQGLIVCSQLLLEPDSDKSIRLYTRLLANLGAGFADGLLSSAKGDGQRAVEAVMALPCPPCVDYEAMKAYYTDPEFSLNNLGEGLYGWMTKKERSRSDGTFRIRNPKEERWFLSCFVHLLEPAEDGTDGDTRCGQLQVRANCAYDIYLNGSRVPEPEKHIELKRGINRLIAIVQGGEEELRFGMIFKNADGTCMRNLQYRLTIDEVEPK